MFRLRWEIQPAAGGGRVVIAAPYVHTAVGVGVGLGLPEAWLREVLRFAPAPGCDAPGQGAQTGPRAGGRRAGARLRRVLCRGARRVARRVQAAGGAGHGTMGWLAETAALDRGATPRRLVESLAGYEQPAGSAAPVARADSQRT